eukprot:TRINITY_DN18345_c0_g1_i1.p1 TRINITY_DN18345_c0_g1~~TRINITY_DN18345_c0_g1_i1.p1  ORF type:complete len:466 (-),score=107.54 TRINITY_DN18345_c0_g1_i1:448-1845(-)
MPKTIIQIFYLLSFKFSETVSIGSEVSDNSDYLACKENGGKVVSHVFCLPNSYRKDVLPPTDGHPLPVFFKLPVSEISEIDDHKSIVTIRLSYKLQWPEQRMVVNQSADWGKEDEINISPDNIEHIWTPDVIIHDLVSFNKPEILNQVGALEIFKNKKVYYKVRSDITIVCKAMEFGQFPLDKHKCYLMLTSFGYDSLHMTLAGKFSYQKENQRTLSFNVEINKLPKYKTVFTGSSSNYSVYGFEIRLSRSLGPFILSIYLPSAMFVMMSWVSFFVPPDIVPARIVLLVTLCLVLINMFNFTTARIPVSNAVTAMEVWLLACMLLVFLSLVEYTVILRKIVNHNRALERYKKDVSRQKSAELLNGQQSSTAFLLQVEDRGGETQTQVTELLPKECRKRCKKPKTKPKSQNRVEANLNLFKLNLDRGATYLFPFLFLLFNCCYWTVYLVIMPRYQKDHLMEQEENN